ncbi:MAG: hypothetical protein CSA45_06445, partial [Gammaproteobacteria bacterium]
MSQILDAINKAEKQRQDALETQQVSRETLYHSLNPNKNNKKRGQRLPFILLSLGCLAAVAYWIYSHQWQSATIDNKAVQRVTAPTNTPLQAQTNTAASSTIANTANKTAKINPTLTASTTIPDSAADKTTITANARSDKIAQQAAKESKQSAISASSQAASMANIKGKKPPALAALTPMAKRPAAIPQQLSQLKPIAKAPVAQKAALRPALQSLPAEKPNKAATPSSPTASALVKTAATSANNVPQSAATPSWKKDI